MADKISIAQHIVTYGGSSRGYTSTTETLYKQIDEKFILRVEEFSSGFSESDYTFIDNNREYWGKPMSLQQAKQWLVEAKLQGEVEVYQSIEN